MKITELNGKWHMRFAGNKRWYDAQVPGSVFCDLLRNGAMEDPFWGDNEYKALEISKSDFEYERSFEFDKKGFERFFLNCKGLDTLCDVYLNDKLILTADNMHRHYKAEITDYLKNGKNRIRVYIKSATMYAIRKNSERFLTSCADAVPGISHIRKAHYMFGWDWGPKLPDCGIWRDIYIESRNQAWIDDVQVFQDGTDNLWRIDVRTDTEGRSEGTEVLYTLSDPNGKIIYSGENSVIEINNPKLWWPNNIGSQPLYTLTVTLLCGESGLDERKLRIGLRKIRLIRQPDKWGESFEFEINGQSIFAMGANYIPEDNLLPRRNRERSERLIRECVRANFNMLRVWGGGYYPDDWFYDLCDEYGLLVWQDHLYACGAYEFNDSFKDSITAETIDNVRRLCHHACLALWSGNNELEYAWAYWGWEEAYGKDLKNDYLSQFEKYLPELMKKLDSQTSYITSSPTSSGGFDDPNDENRGDMHYWDVWHGRKDYEEYKKLNPRFMSEFGLQSFPDEKTISSFTPPEEMNVYSYTMECHQKNNTGNEKIIYYISRYFRFPKNLSAIAYLSQFVQAEGIRSGVEHWRRMRGRCMGALYWQLNDCWPVVSWAGIDYYGRLKALHYFAKHFYEPILIGAEETDNGIVIFISNETKDSVSETVTWRLMKFDGSEILSGECQAEVSHYSAADIALIQIPQFTYDEKRSLYLEYGFISSEQRKAVFFVPFKHLKLDAPEIKYNISHTDGGTQVQVTAEKPALFVEIKADDSVFSDNYFHLIPGRTVEIISDEYIDRDNIQIRTLYDSY